MKIMRQKILAVVMTTVMMITLIPNLAFAADGHEHKFDDNNVCDCGAHADCAKGTPHEGWTELTQADFEKSNTKYYDTSKDGYILDDTTATDEVKNYYLGGDIELGSIIKVGLTNSGTVNLCLNGHMITNDESNSSSQTFLVNNGATLNIYDCKDTPHYFTKSEESNPNNRFNVYEDSYDTQGQTENEDYIKVLGGGITNVKQICEINGNAIVNMYGGTVIGCNKNDLFNIGAGSLNMRSIIIKENITKYRDMFYLSDGATVKLNGCEIFNNDVGTAIIDRSPNIKIQLIDTSIYNNEISGTAAIYATHNDFSSELELSGNTIVKDNKKKGKQYNICTYGQLSGGFLPIKVKNLTSAENSIGLSSYYPLKENTKQLVLENAGDNIKALYSDDSMGFLELEGSDLMLKHRVHGQPSKSNEYKFDIEEEGLKSVEYQWYDGEIEVTELTDKNTFDRSTKGDYIDGVWTSKVNTWDEHLFNTFDARVSADTRFKCRINFDNKLPQKGLYIKTFLNGSSTDATVSYFKESGDYICPIAFDGELSQSGCLCEEPKENMPKIEEAHIEKIIVKDKVPGANTNRFTLNDTGDYVCKAIVEDQNGNKSEFTSEVVHIDRELYSDFTELILLEFKCYLPVVKATAGEDKKAHLTWNKCSAADGYDVYCKNNFGKFELVDTVTTNSCETKISPQYKVKAFRLSKDKKLYGRFSDPADLVYPDETEKEVIPTFKTKTKITKLKSKKKGKMTLKFKAIPGVKQYQVYYKVGKKAKTLNVKKTSLTIKKLKSKKKYTVKVRGIMKYGTKNLIGPWSPAKKVKIK